MNRSNKGLSYVRMTVSKSPLVHSALSGGGVPRSSCATCEVCVLYVHARYRPETYLAVLS